MVVVAAVAVAVAAVAVAITTTATAAAVAAAMVVTVVVVVATDKHITLLFKTRSGIKHNAKRCSDVSPCSAFCFSQLFLTTHAFLVLSLSTRLLFLFLLFSFLLRPYIPYFGLFLSLSLFLSRYHPSSPSPFHPPSLSPIRSLSLDTVYKPQPTPSSRRVFFESYCTMRFE